MSESSAAPVKKKRRSNGGVGCSICASKATCSDNLKDTVYGAICDNALERLETIAKNAALGSPRRRR